MATCPCLNDETLLCEPCKRTYACRGCWPAVKNVRKLELCAECLAKEEAKNLKRSTFETLMTDIDALDADENYDYDQHCQNIAAVLKKHGWTDLDFTAEASKQVVSTLCRVCLLDECPGCQTKDPL